MSVMAAPKKDPAKKPAKQSRTKDVGMQFYTDQQHADALTRYIESFPEELRPKKGVTLEAALRMLLSSKGFWPPPADPK